MVPLLDPVGNYRFEEIKLVDVSSYMTNGFFVALRWWKRCQKHGLPRTDWRDMTIAQMEVLNVFDTLWSRRK